MEFLETGWHTLLVVALALVVLGIIIWIVDVVPLVADALDFRHKRPVPKHRIRRGTVTRAFAAESSGSAAFGKVESDGTIWTAQCTTEEAERIAVGDEVRVQRIDGLTLVIAPKRR